MTTKNTKRGRAFYGHKDLRYTTTYISKSKQLAIGIWFKDIRIATIYVSMSKRDRKKESKP